MHPTGAKISSASGRPEKYAAKALERIKQDLHRFQLGNVLHNKASSPSPTYNDGSVTGQLQDEVIYTLDHLYLTGSSDKALQRLSKTNSRFEMDYQQKNVLESTSSPQINESVSKIMPLTTKVMRKQSIERDYSQTLQFQRKSPALDSGAGSSRSDSPHLNQQISTVNRVSSGLYNATSCTSNFSDAPPLPPPRNSTPPTPPPAPNNLQLYKRRSPAAARSAVLPAQSPVRGTSPVPGNTARQPPLMLQTTPKTQQQKQNLNIYQTGGSSTEPPPPYHINTTVPQPPPIFANNGGQSPTQSQSDYRKSPSSGIYSATSGGSPSPIAISGNVIVPQNSTIHPQPWGAYQTRTQPPIIMQSVKSTQVQKPVLQTAIAPVTPATPSPAHVPQAPPSYASSVHQKTQQASSIIVSNPTICLKPQASQTTPPTTPPLITNGITSNTVVSSTEPPSYAITIQAIKAAQQQQTRQLPPPPPYQVSSSNNNHNSCKNSCITDAVNYSASSNLEIAVNISNQPVNFNDNTTCQDSSGDSSPPSTILSLSAITDESNELLFDRPKPQTSQIKTERCTKIKHQSPIPERKKVSKEKEEERKEFRIRHYSPQAFKFFMEQHIENVIKSYKQRTFRKNQLEKEMVKIGLSTQAQIQMRRMLNQKESNYIRLKRAKMDKSMFVQIKHIGVGAFGEVSLVQKIDSTNHLYAMKTLRKTDVLKRNQVAHVKAERDILAEADNEWVVKLYYSFQDRDNLYFVMDYIPGGDLMSLLIKKGIFEEPLAKFYIAELTCAVESVHKMGFIHRDIKPDNILIDRDGHIKLTDFGLCTGFRWTHNSKYYQENDHVRQDSMEPWEILGEHDIKQTLLERRRIRDHQRVLAHSLVGTPNYIAPEVLERSGYTQLCDWWSVGVILYEMLVGQPPFLANTPVETQQKVINWEKTLNIPLQSKLSREASDLIRQLCSSADRRLGRRAEEVKAHVFFKGIDFADMRKQKAPYVPKIEHPTDTSNFDPIDPDKLRASPAGSNKSGDDFADSGKPFHGFFEFTFRRFFDDKLNSDLTDDQSPVYV